MSIESYDKSNQIKSNDQLNDHARTVIDDCYWWWTYNIEYNIENGTGQDELICLPQFLSVIILNLEQVMGHH